MSNHYPVYLAHGIARFDALSNIVNEILNIQGHPLVDRFHYFKGIKTFLENNGFDSKIIHGDVDFGGSLEKRANELRRNIRKIDAEKVHIIAHSMGGLDARKMIVEYEDMADKVASLTTVGTPHKGTPIADVIIEQGLGRFAEKRPSDVGIFDFLGRAIALIGIFVIEKVNGEMLIDLLKPIIDLEGYKDLTTTACKEFNENNREKESQNNVAYRTLFGSQEKQFIFLPLQARWTIISLLGGGENDGLVSVESQKWEPELTTDHGKRKLIRQDRIPFSADHLNQVGWWDPHEPEGREKYEKRVQQFYLDMANDCWTMDV